MAKTIDIYLHSVKDIKDLADIAKRMEGDVNISSGRYRVDAKSIMGIYVLDISGPVCLEIEMWKKEYEEMLKPYMVLAGESSFGK